MRVNHPADWPESVTLETPQPSGVECNTRRKGPDEVNMIQPTDRIWHNGEFIDLGRCQGACADPRSPLRNQRLRRVSAATTRAVGPAVFRLPEHVRRMFDSAKIYRMTDLGFSQEEITQACKSVIDSERSHLVLHPPDRFPWVLGDVGSPGTRQSDRILYCVLGMGPLPRSGSLWRRESTSASRHGPGSLRTPCRP